MKKIILILCIILFSNCSKDCNDDGDNGLDFDLKIRLSSTNGENLFLNPEFDIERLIVRRLGESTSDNSRFREILENDVRLLEYYVFTDNEIEILYDNEQKAIISLTNKEFDTIDCNLIAKSFTASNNGQFICDCVISDIITIEFNL